jgi:hypothetical protein
LGCNLNVSGAQLPIENKLPLTYHQFADAITLDTASARLALGKNVKLNERFIVFPSVDRILPVPIRHIEQRRSWKFDMRKYPGYIAEVSTTQSVDVDHQHRKPRQERWSVQLYHEQWDTIFSENRKLKIGQRAKWVATEAQFFSCPRRDWHEDREGMVYSTGSGIMQLMEAIGMLKNIIAGKVEKEQNNPTALTIKPPVALAKVQVESPCLPADEHYSTASIADFLERETIAPRIPRLTEHQNRFPTPAMPALIPVDRPAPHPASHSDRLRESTARFGLASIPEDSPVLLPDPTDFSSYPFEPLVNVNCPPLQPVSAPTRATLDRAAKRASEDRNNIDQLQAFKVRQEARIAARNPDEKKAINTYNGRYDAPSQPKRAQVVSVTEYTFVQPKKSFFCDSDDEDEMAMFAIGQLAWHANKTRWSLD